MVQRRRCIEAPARAWWALACAALLPPAARGRLGLHRAPPGRRGGRRRAARRGPRALFQRQRRLGRPNTRSTPTCGGRPAPRPKARTTSSTSTRSAPPRSRTSRAWRPTTGRGTGSWRVDNGRVPWRVGEVYRELVAAFRAGDEARVLERAAVAGALRRRRPRAPARRRQLQRGAHRPARRAPPLGERPRGPLPPPARGPGSPGSRRPRVGEPVGGTFEDAAGVLRRRGRPCSNRTAPWRARGTSRTRPKTTVTTTPTTRACSSARASACAAACAAASRLAGLWLRAWQEAGRPPLDASFRYPYVRGRSRAVLLSLDGAAAPLIDDAVARGLMPALAALRAGGAVARGSLPPLPCKTAAGHAALFTGAWGDRSGITGNEVPVPAGTIRDVENGFSSTPLAAEPLWVAAARQGLDATVASATHAFPFGPYLDERRFGGELPADAHAARRLPVAARRATARTRPPSSRCARRGLAGAAARARRGAARVHGRGMGRAHRRARVRRSRRPGRRLRHRPRRARPRRAQRASP